ncbi:MAG: hypothetical protein GX200_04955 [Firmicutes bacterium]|nr:hypothetical protein [Bacillota bacterium]
MMEFRQELKRRICGGGVYCLVVAFLVIFSRAFDVESLAFSFSLGFAIGIEFVVLYFIAKYRAALKDEQKLKLLYIEENDEREEHINLLIGKSGIKIILVSLSVAMLIAAYINQIVFFTLLAATLYTVVVVGALKIFYKKTV